MKPLGIRFEKFACFDECYLRLDEGMQVLVGKNNAGKTAILRGLTALHGLPVGTTEPLPFTLGGYAHGSTGLGNFDFHVEYSFEKSDFGLLGGAIEKWPNVTHSVNRMLDFHFRVIGVGNFVGLVGATLTFDNRHLPALQTQSGNVIQLQYDQTGSHTGGMQLRKISDRASNNETWPVFESTGLLSELERLKNVRMIEAHRVARTDIGMQAVHQLTPNVETLAPFLDTLSGNKRRKFQEVEALVTRVFPDLEFVNPEKRQNAVLLTLTKQQNDYAIPLTQCGTRVEQVLALGAFVLDAPAGSTLLLDEPHSYLHPSAEREIIGFLQEHSEHRYVISTHSAILINAVPPDKVIAVTSPKMTRTSRQQPVETPALLHSLGYKNSDFLFSDRLVFVEGESDQQILPILLEKDGAFEKSDIARTGFPKMDEIWDCVRPIFPKVASR